MQKLYEDKIYVDDEEYRLITIRNRPKYVNKYGDGINPYKRNQKATKHMNHDGYPCFGGGIPVHIYVAHAWVDGWFEGAEVNHKDFNRLNSSWDNLEWTTHKDNVQYSRDKNTGSYSNSKIGSKNGRSVLDELSVKRIKQLRYLGLKISDITRVIIDEFCYEKDYRSVRWNVENVVNNKTWTHINI